MSYCQSKDSGVSVSIYVQPQASKTQIVGLYNGALKIKIKAPPVDGKANEEVIRFFSELLKKPKRSVHLTSGETSRNKKIFIENCTIDEVISSCGSF